ncbi:MAG: putative heme transporter [Thermoleophilaceae bacterium]|jgi:uncharacterized protein (TIRG00374 family)|nr:putative heme transporter [Thermoleophilaceae bacterium]
MKRRAIALVITAVVLYGAWPAVLEVLGAFNDLDGIKPWWWGAVLVSQGLALTCFCEVQRLAMHTREWFPVVTSNLASGGLSKVVPGGSATAAALQFQMLRRADVGGAGVVTGLAAGSLLLLGTLAALPLLALPSVIGGLNVPAGLFHASLIGLALFAVLFVLSFLLIRSDRAVDLIGRAAEWVACKVLRRTPRDIPGRLRGQRDRARQALGENLAVALAASAGRWLFDFLTLLAALSAVGARPPLSLALLAYAAAQLLAQFPVTPGGVGVVEAGMTGTLALAGVAAGPAALATLIYRLGSYWLQMPVGLVAWLLYRRRYGAVVAAPAAPEVSGS